MSLYFRLLSAGIRARLQYKWDFIVSTLFYALVSAVDFLTVAAIIFRFPRVGGWGFYEIALLSGLSGTSYGLFRAFGSELYTFEKYLVSGEFDGLLIRPWPTLLSLLARNFDLGRVGGALQGIILMVLGLRGVVANGAPLWLVPYALVLPLAGTGIVAAIAVVTNAAGFWITRVDELTIFTINAPITAANFPLSIYPGWLRKLLTGMLPVAAIGYLPLLYALGKGGSAAYLLAPFAVAAAALTISVQFWRWGERHYQSTGN